MCITRFLLVLSDRAVWTHHDIDFFLFQSGVSMIFPYKTENLCSVPMKSAFLLFSFRPETTDFWTVLTRRPISKMVGLLRISLVSDMNDFVCHWRAGSPTWAQHSMKPGVLGVVPSDVCTNDPPERLLPKAMLCGNISLSLTFLSRNTCILLKYVFRIHLVISLLFLALLLCGEGLQLSWRVMAAGLKQRIWACAVGPQQRHRQHSGREPYCSSNL